MDDEFKEKTICRRCYDKNKEEQSKKRAEPETKISSNEALILKQEIKRLQSSGGSITTLIILGIVGLFFYLLPGIIFFVLAAILSSSKKSKIASLKAQLCRLQSTKEDLNDYLILLKKKFIDGKITEEEYKRKKTLIEEK